MPKDKTPAEVAAERVLAGVKKLCSPQILITEIQEGQIVNEVSSYINEAFTEEHVQYGKMAARVKVLEGLLGGPSQKRPDFDRRYRLWQDGYWAGFRDIRGEYESYCNPQKASAKKAGGEEE